VGEAAGENTTRKPVDLVAEPAWSPWARKGPSSSPNREKRKEDAGRDSNLQEGKGENTTRSRMKKVPGSKVMNSSPQQQQKTPRYPCAHGKKKK